MSFALARLLPEEKKAVKERLWKRQNGVCFITQKKIDLSLDETEVDHIVPTRDKGPDDESNWAVVFARANESKQPAHLYVARVLHLLDVIREKTNDPRGANLGDVLAHFGGAKYQLHAKADGEKFQYKLTQMNLYDESMSPIWVDELSGMRTTFLRLPSICITITKLIRVLSATRYVVSLRNFIASVTRKTQIRGRSATSAPSETESAPIATWVGAEPTKTALAVAGTCSRLHDAELASDIVATRGSTPEVSTLTIDHFLQSLLLLSG